MTHTDTHAAHRHVLRNLGQAGLTVSALAGLLCIVAALACVVFGVRPLVFVSGSMAPTIDTGDLAFARTVAAADLRVGDVVSVPASTGARVTHRIQAIEHTGSAASLTLKGDANASSDAKVSVVASADRVLFHVPELGYLIHALTTPVGVATAAAGSACWMFLLLRPTSPRRGRHRLPWSPTKCILPAALLLLGFLTAAQSTRTLATFTDSASAHTTGLTAHTMLPATGVNCADEGASLTYTWPHRDIRYEYVVTLLNEQGSTFKTFTVTPASNLAAGQPVTQSVSETDVNTVETGDSFTVRVQSRVNGSTTWSSPYATDTGHVQGIVILTTITRDLTC